jgi:hypothetical protein
MSEIDWWFFLPYAMAFVSMFVLAEVAVYSVWRKWRGARAMLRNPAGRLRIGFAGVMVALCVNILWFAAYRLDTSQDWMREIPVAATMRVAVSAFAAVCICELARGLPWWVVPVALAPPLALLTLVAYFQILH